MGFKAYLCGSYSLRTWGSNNIKDIDTWENPPRFGFFLASLAFGQTLPVASSHISKELVGMLEESQARGLSWAPRVRHCLYHSVALCRCQDLETQGSGGWQALSCLYLHLIGKIFRDVNDKPRITSYYNIVVRSGFVCFLSD